MFDYVKTAKTAGRLIEKFGLAVTLKRRGTATYNPATGSATPSETMLQTFGMFVDIEQTVDGMTGTGISANEVGIVLSHEVRPAEGDTLMANGKVYEVLRVMPIAPAGMALMYKLALKAN